MQPVKPFTVMNDERGKLIEVLKEGTWKQLNHFTIKKDGVRGKHYHKKLVEAFYVVAGKVKFEVKHVQTGKSDEFVLKEGESVIIQPLDYHVLTALEDVTMISLYSEVFDPTDLHAK